ncbi:MAG: PAS domain S-box protein, partial [Candidatus Electrothrix sp. ATG2]|nr:PAS domain S-box protein [Candidatus Electrothrix sp. ATG2]
MEEALSESEEKFRGIFNDALDMIHIVDSQGCIIDANPTELKVMEFSREEYMNRPFCDFLHPDDKKVSATVFQQVLAGKTVRNYETSLLTKTGCKVEVEITSVPQFEDGTLVSVRSISRDITERKKTEKELAGHREFLEKRVEKRTKELRNKMHELERSEASAQKRAEELIRMRRAMLNIMEDLKEARLRAEAGSQAKSVFLANMSHELRTPLNAILGFSQLMQTDPQASTSQLEKLHIINRSGHHLLQLINDVLDMSKIEAGRMQLDLQDLDLGELVRDVIDMMRLRAEEKGISLTLAQDSSFPRFIHGDGPKLRQILINLVGNAVKFTETGEVSVHLHAENGRPDSFVLHGEVQDTGPGIVPEDIERIFRPFKQ